MPMKILRNDEEADAWVPRWKRPPWRPLAAAMERFEDEVETEREGFSAGGGGFDFFSSRRARRREVVWSSMRPVVLRE